MLHTRSNKTWERDTLNLLPAQPWVCLTFLDPATASPPGGEHLSPEAAEVAELASLVSPPRWQSRLAPYQRREAACGELPGHKTPGCATSPTLLRTRPSSQGAHLVLLPIKCTGTYSKLYYIIIKCAHMIQYTFMVVHSSVAVFMQQLLHSTECDGSEVTGVLQLEETLQVRCCLTPRYVHPLAVDSIQPKNKYIPLLK